MPRPPGSGGHPASARYSAPPAPSIGPAGESRHERPDLAATGRADGADPGAAVACLGVTPAGIRPGPPSPAAGSPAPVQLIPDSLTATPEWPIRARSRTPLDAQLSKAHTRQAAWPRRLTSLSVIRPAPASHAPTRRSARNG